MMQLVMLVGTVAWVWLIVIAFKSDRMLWGFLILFFTFPAFVYGPLNWDKAKIPFLLFVASFVVLLFMVLSGGQIEAVA